MIENSIIIGYYEYTASGNSLSGPYSNKRCVNLTLDMLTPEFQKVIKQYLNIPG